MYLFKNVSGLRAFLEPFRTKNRAIGFVPTMGALHEGHLSLIRESLAATHCTVCSIFVNPTQFNQQADLEQYPRTPAKDLQMLYEVGCQAVFMPTVEAIYPPGLDTSVAVDFGQLAEGMEGRFRPGHFQGVAQVVKRLLDIVQPSHLYMGQKDYQQCFLVRHMAQALALPVEVVMSPTVREANGLAMSSRNARLNPEQRKQAAIIYKTLQDAGAWIKQGLSPAEVQEKALQQLTIPGFRPEYFEIINGQTLQQLNEAQPDRMVVACTAVWAGEVRLIDNLILQTGS